MTPSIRPGLLHVTPPPVSTSVKVSVVIVNYRQWRSTFELVDGLLDSHACRLGAVEIIIIDNQAAPSTLRRKLRKLPGVSVRAFRRNRGFAKAVNEGCRLSLGGWLLVLNPDVTVPAGFLDTVVAAAERWRVDGRTGVVGCRLLNRDGSLQGSAGADPTLRRLLWSLTRPRHRRKCPPLAASEPVEVPWVTGCGMLIRRECLHDIGGFDPRYFVYYEDVDLCRRARAAGWSVWHDPNLALAHDRPLHLRNPPAHLRLLTRHALLTYAALHWSKWQFFLLCQLATLDAGWRERRERRRGRRRSANVYAELQRLIADLRHGRFDMAYRRAWHVAQRQVTRHERPRRSR